MKQLITLPKIRKYDSKGRKMTRSEQLKDLKDRITKALESNKII